VIIRVAWMAESGYSWVEFVACRAGGF